MKKFFIWIGVCGLLLVAMGYYFLFASNTGDFRQKAFIYIPTGSSYAQLLQQIEKNNLLHNLHSFDRMAQWLGLPNHLHAGKYQIREGMGNFTIAWMLKGGRQVPVRLVIRKMRTENDLVHKFSSELEPDSSSFKSLFHDTSFLNQYQLKPGEIQALILPDTYQFYWNTTARKVLEKLGKNYRNFWNEERLRKAEKLNMRPAEIATLASIVEEETNLREDEPKVASTYLNRLRKGIPLQADPTVKFGIGDFSIQRITGNHIQVSSPYNTYKNKGLPPGPICTPSAHSIDAVLDAPQTDYLYFCASWKLDGHSDFTASYEEHLRNAKKYQQALNERGIH
ncbi:MAG TPA: endolytic transglycosylase MltG [Chitinophagaceae bacterium]|nr:endolytic transglycosylase MltG [Chitinophagaceae bacterium]